VGESPVPAAFKREDGIVSLLRFLGLGGSADERSDEPASIAALSAELESLPPEDARFVSAFAYLLARIAGSDLRVEASEETEIARHLAAFGDLAESQARLLATSAVRVADVNSAADNHLVARAFRDMTELPERLRLLRCLYAVAAADETISTAEDNEIFEVASAIGVAREQVIALRSEFTDYLGSMKTLSTET
jgi:uncharacterized tellurite resistance protein B-like protein